MNYTLLNNKKGIVLSRKPEIVKGDLLVRFYGAPEGVTAIFEREDGESLYRALTGEECTVPAGFLRGKLRVYIAALSGNPRAPRWVCEGLLAETEHGVTVVAPDDEELEQRFIEMQIEESAMRETIGNLFKEVEDLKAQLEKIMEGYDFV